MRRIANLVLIGLAILGLACWLSSVSITQSPMQDRITGPIAESPPVWLEGNLRPIFHPENDQGPAPDSLKLENITLMFKPTDGQQSNLAALLEQQQDRSSPLYHHWLTPEQFADNFGLSPSDMAKAVAWLESQGFTITQTARSRLWVSFTGTAAQVQSAFRTEIHNYSVGGKTYYANASEPSVPAALAEVVLGFHSLDNYAPKPHSVFRRMEAGPKPDFTSYLSGKNFVAPGDFAVIYDVNALYSNGIDGTGQSIAVMGQTDLYENGSDITAFRSASGLEAKLPQVVLVPGVSDPGVVSGDINEASLDVEWSGAVAKNATIIFVNGGSSGVFNNALPYAIDHNLAPVISLSYGNCEANWSSSSLQQFSVLAQQANTQGITMLAASGDSGPADCDYSNSATVVLTSATHGYAVDFPASLPYVTAMGGTEFNEGKGTYWLPATGTTDVSPSALSYIPEMVWNDTSTTNGLLAGGGGVSEVFAKPSWQVGITPNDGFRDVPDLSLNASPVHDSYLVCVQGSCVNGYRLPANDPSYPNGLTVAGGTSAGAPTTAGIVALINQQMNTPKGQGNINPILYSLAATSPAAFHDIITGNNLVPCTVGSTDCPASGQIGYTATPGYDLASGLGSYDAFNLVTAPEVWNLPPPALTSPANQATDEPVSPQFTWTAVAGNAGYRIMIATSSASLPTNPATSTCPSCTVVGATSANSNSFTPPSTLAVGTAYYWEVQALGASGSGQNGMWSAVSSFTTVTPDFSLSASPSTLAISPGTGGTSTLTLTPINSFSSAPTFTCSVPSTLAGVICTVGPLGGNNTATVTITASTSATSYPMLPRNPPLDGWWVAGAALLCLLLIARTKLRPDGARRPLWNARRGALVAVLAALVAATLSCGGGGGGGTPAPTPESGTITVTGTSGNLTHNTQISVTVS